MNNKLSLKNYIFILIALLIILTCFSIYTQNLASAQEPTNFFPENTDKNINNQFFTICVLFLMGFFVLLPFGSKIEINYLMILSYIIGIITYCFISICLLLCRINLNILSILIVYVVVLTFIYIKNYVVDKQKPSNFKNNIPYIVFWFIILLAFGYVSCKTNFSILTFDSIQYKTLGNSFGKFNSITPYTYYTLVGHSFIPTLINTISVFAGFEFAYGIQNLFMLNCVALFSYLIYDYTKSFDIKHPLLTALIPTAILASSFFVVFLSISLVTNMFAGYFLLFFVIFIERYKDSFKSQDIVFSFIFALAFCFSRVEAPLIIAFILAYLSHNKLPTKTVLKFTSFLTGIIIFYYWTFLSFIGTSTESAFLSFDKCLLIVLILATIIVYTKLKEKYFMSKNDLLLKIYLVSVLIFTIVLSFMDITKSIHNITTIYTNIFAEGMWVISWFVVIIFTCISIILNGCNTDKKDLTKNIIYIYLVLLFALFAFRTDNLHLNWSDSGNRLLMHIYPVIIYSIYKNLIYYFHKKRNVQEITE